MPDLTIINGAGKEPAPDAGYNRVAYGIQEGLRALGFTVEAPDYPKEPLGNCLVIGSPHRVFWQELPQPPQNLWLYTMAETDRINTTWVHTINQYYQAMIVPVPGLRSVFLNSGVKIPIHVLPIGLDIAAPEYRERHYQRGDEFTFMTYTYGDHRKGAELVIAAFVQLFGGDERFQLVVKVRPPGDWVMNIKHKQISYINGKLPVDEYFETLYNAHCFVFPSRGEGRGLPPIEAVMSGMPALSTQWLGSWDANIWAAQVIQSERFARAQFSGDCVNHREANWNIPDRYSVMAGMLAVVEDYEAAKRKTSVGNQYLRTQTWRMTTEAIANFMGLHNGH